jgi:hypothetical protein
LYIVGGHDFEVYHNEMWIFDLKTKSWALIADHQKGADYVKPFERACMTLNLIPASLTMNLKTETNNNTQDSKCIVLIGGFGPKIDMRTIFLQLILTLIF